MTARSRPATRAATRPATRLARLEARVAAARPPLSIHDACDRWTDRFERASPAHADLIRRVVDRRLVRAYIWFGEPGKPRPCAAYLRFGLIYQARDRLWPDEGLPPMPPVVPDPEVVVALLSEFSRALAYHQADTGDLYPRAGFDVRELGLMAIAERRRKAAAAEGGGGVAGGREHRCACALEATH